MSAIAIIPARYGSIRLPGKPLLNQTGKPLIQHCVESVRTAKLIDSIVVATDDERIAGAVEGFGGTVVMTSSRCPSGTDRLAEAAEKLELGDDQIVVNVQGDEPDIPGHCIDTLVELIENSSCPIATLATPLPADQAGDPDKVKVVLDSDGRAIYFSRAKIPHERDRMDKMDKTLDTQYLLHIGIYAYRVATLRKFASLAPSPAEQAEKLEQLRAMEHGIGIAVAIVDYHSAGIDTPEDYAKFVAKFNQKKEKHDD